MLTNFIKIAIRNIRRHKLFTFINIFSLTLSLTICLAVLMVIKNQLDFDEFHPYPERTYRIITEAKHKRGHSVQWATSPLPLGKYLKNNYEFIESTVRFYSFFGKATAAEKKLDISGKFTDPAFFNIFGFELKSGNPATALSEPFSIVLTHETANKFFGDQNPVGKSFFIDEVGNFKITGVLKPFPENTHLAFGLLGSMSTMPLLEKRYSANSMGWGHYTIPFTYILIKPDTEFSTLNEVIASVSNRISNNYELSSYLSKYVFHLQSLDDITPGKELRGDMNKSRSPMYLLFLSSIALVILLMACFNYTNLSIARALKRAREVGMYKILGAGRFSIIVQFVIQAIIISFVSVVIAYALLPFIPLPNDFMKEVFSASPDLTLFIWFFLFAVFTGLLAGGLPAWILSRLKPIQMVKNIKNIKLIEGLTVRKTLVVVQFALSLILIIYTTVIYRQAQFAATADYGFQQKNIINLELEGVNYKVLENEISKIAGVEEVSSISRPFGTFATDVVNLQKAKSDPGVRVESFSVSPNILTNLQIDLLAGNTIPKEASSETEHFVLVNEQMLTALNWENPADAVGQTVWLDDTLQVVVSGVIEDFHYESLSRGIGPLLLRYRPEEFRYLNIRVAATNVDVVKNIENVWKKITPGQPIEYSFYDEFIYATNAHEEDVAAIVFLALIALSIACLGLLGMVTYTVEVRTQEVGIRKVLGASVERIILLLSKEFIWLLGLAALIGLPVGYWLGLQFLSTYAYRISIGVGTLTLGLGVLLIVGLLAIGIQTWQTARANPIDSIRSEV